VTSTDDRFVPRRWQWCLAILLGCVLAGTVWSGLLRGGGIVGGDTYPYFFPQKVVLAEAFSRGTIPLWNDRTSLGYPMHAESQAGIFYPSNQVLYRIFDVNMAYNASILLHYAAAFVMAWRFSRAQRLKNETALFAALIYVYGWFPVRLSLEWSIIGGVWFPLSLWMTDRFLNRGSFRRWGCLAASFAVHLLAGHFTLAFVTQITCVLYAILQGRRWKPGAAVLAAIAVGLMLAAVQLVPTLELRQLSQRDGSNPAFNPAYGHMPPVYLSQLVASWWFWHTPELVQTREMMKYPWLMSSADSNQVEAHLYLGLLPVLLLLGLFSAKQRLALNSTNWKLWMGMSAGAILYAFGWLVPVLKNVPGFGFFMGPGRYTIVSTLGLAMVCGLVLDVMMRRRAALGRTLICGGLAVLTLADVLASSRYPVCDAQIISEPPIRGVVTSEIRKRLKEEAVRGPVRLLAPGANVANLFEVSSVPQYLGLGPGEYFSDEWKLETQPTSDETEFPSTEQLSRLQRLAVTHILTTEAVNRPSGELEVIYRGPDDFLNRVWGRGSAPCFLYRIKNARPRVTGEPDLVEQVDVLQQQPGEVEFEVEVSESTIVEWTDLMFPGWYVTVDGTQAAPITQAGFGRKVEVTPGKHRIRWFYAPRSFLIGVGISVITGLSLALGALVQRTPKSEAEQKE
jgi:hypothetical protein